MSLRELASIDAKRVINLDAEVFGVPRPEIVSHLQNAEPRRAVVAKSTGRLVGFALARPGRRALHLGPVTANRAEIAQALVSRALAGAKGAIVIDVPDHQDRFQAWLTSAGFLPVFPLMRMRAAPPRSATPSAPSPWPARNSAERGCRRGAAAPV